MNEITYQFLLAGNLLNYIFIKFMPQVHLRQPGFIYSVCGPFKKQRKNPKI